MTFDVIPSKIICILGVLASKVLVGLIPCSLRKPLTKLANGSKVKRQRFTLFVTYFHCFSAGTLLSQSLLSLLPDCQRLLQDIINGDIYHSKFPLAEMLTVFGIFLTLIIDRIVHHVQKSQCRGWNPDSTGSSDSGTSTTPKHTTVVYSLNRNQLDPEDEFDMSDIIAENQPNLSDGHKEVTHNEETVPELSLQIQHCEFQSLFVKSGCRKSPVYAILTVLCLSVPSIFACIVLGLQRNTIELWTLFSAVVFREVIESFTLGIELARYTQKSYQDLVGAVGLSVLASLGVVIGTAVESYVIHSPSSMALLAVIQCLTNGSILYIIFLDILLNRLKDNYGFPRVVATLVGFALMTFVIGVLH